MGGANMANLAAEIGNWFIMVLYYYLAILHWLIFHINICWALMILPHDISPAFTRRR
jgi:hypothetical protein